MNLRKTATIIIIIGFALLITSCTAIYKFIGLTEKQAEDQTAKDRQITIDVLETGREQIWQLATAAVTALGGITSGLLARWLGTERKITTTLISAIETSGADSLKETISSKATSAGIEPKLNARVRALT